MRVRQSLTIIVLLVGGVRCALFAGGDGPGRVDGADRRFIPAARMTVHGRGYSVAGGPGRRGAPRVSFAAPNHKALSASGHLQTRLERELAPGNYLVWLAVGFDKTSRRTGEDPVRIAVRLGEKPHILRIDRSPKTPSCARGVLAVDKPFRTVRLKVLSPERGLILERLYLSSETDDLGLADRTSRLATATEMIRRKVLGHFSDPEGDAGKANWLANGSFEVGIGNFDWSTPYQRSYTLSPDSWDDAQPADGRRCLCVRMYPTLSRFRGDDPDLPTNFRLMHKVLRLRPHTTYHFRGMFRAEPAASVTVSAGPAYPAGRAGETASQTFQLDSKWKPVTMPITTGANGHGVLLSLSGASAGPAKLWMDSLTLTAEKVERFVPASPLEVGVHWTAPGKLFYRSDPPAFKLLAVNYSPSASATASVRWRVIDYFDRVLVDRTIRDWQLGPGASASKDLKLDAARGAPPPTGIFRLLIDANVRTEAGETVLPLQEYVFSVLPKPPAHMKGTFGAYITVAPQPIEIMARAGIRKTTTLSCSNELLQAWSRIEPEPGKFIWVDGRVSHARRNDVRIVANLELRPGAIPEWAIDAAKGEKDPLRIGGGPRATDQAFSRKAWERFVEALVGHYRGSIRDWLIVDEPYHYFSAGQYAEILKVAYHAAKRGNPNCRVIAHGGYYAPWLPALETHGAVRFFDGISDYARSKAQGRKLKDFGRKHNKFILNVEYSWYPSMYRNLPATRTLWNRTAPNYQEVSEWWIAATLRAMCWSGAVGFGRYDARYPGGDMTQLDLYKSMFEYDGTLKPAGTAYAILAILLDGFHGVAELDLNPRIETFLLADDTRFAIMCLDRDKKLIDVDWTLPDGVKALDFMGNAMPGDAAATLSNAPVYLMGPKAKLEATREAVARAQPRPAVEITARMVLDEDSGQYVLQVRVTNLRRSGNADGLFEMPATALRAFWRPSRHFSNLEPGKSVEWKIGLNAYAHEPAAPRTVTGYLYYDGATIRCPITLSVDTPGNP